MTLSQSQTVINYLWIAVATVWFAMAFTTKRTVRRQTGGSRALQSALGALAVLIGFSNRFRIGPLSQPFVPDTQATGYVGLVLTLGGIAFAIWARLYLGDNWSARVTLKEDHLLITGGPYAIVRHPIYTGLLLAVLGTVVAHREVRGLVGFGLIILMLRLKTQVEESFMMERFGDEYGEYRGRVKALVPFVL